jgi:hypothetical protein
VGLNSISAIPQGRLVLEDDPDSGRLVRSLRYRWRVLCDD